MTIGDHKQTFGGLPVEDWEHEFDEEDDDDEDEGEFRRFEFKDGKSNKFWMIKLEGESFTVRFGRIGTEGQEQTKDFDDEQKARKEYDKLIKEKTGKGYVEVSSGDSGSAAGADAPGFDPEKICYRLMLDYDDAEDGVSNWIKLFKAFLSQPSAARTKALVVGNWGNLCEGDDSTEVIETLVNASKRLPSLEALFLGDVISEECEISWIQQTDISPLFNAFSNLKHFGVRGGQNLSLGTINHKNLQTLIIETGGLSRTVVREVLSSTLPELRHLELWLGEEYYGADVTVEDLRPLLFEDLFPKLQYLGLRNSHIVDQIAQSLKGSPIMNRIEVLDLSMGTLSDEGGQALLDNPAIERLKKLDLHHHYLGEEMMRAFEDLPIEVDLDEPQEANSDGDRYVAVGE